MRAYLMAELKACKEPQKLDAAHFVCNLRQRLFLHFEENHKPEDRVEILP